MIATVAPVRFGVLPSKVFVIIDNTNLSAVKSHQVPEFLGNLVALAGPAPGATIVGIVSGSFEEEQDKRTRMALLNNGRAANGGVVAGSIERLAAYRTAGVETYLEPAPVGLGKESINVDAKLIATVEKITLRVLRGELRADDVAIVIGSGDGNGEGLAADKPHQTLAHAVFFAAIAGIKVSVVGIKGSCNILFSAIAGSFYDERVKVFHAEQVKQPLPAGRRGGLVFTPFETVLPQEVARVGATHVEATHVEATHVEATRVEAHTHRGRARRGRRGPRASRPHTLSGL